MIEQVSYLDPDLLYPDWTVGTYLTLVLFLGIITLNIVGSIFSLIAENKKKEYEENLKSEMKDKVAQKINDSRLEDASVKESAALFNRSELICNLNCYF